MIRRSCRIGSSLEFCFPVESLDIKRGLAPKFTIPASVGLVSFEEAGSVWGDVAAWARNDEQPVVLIPYFVGEGMVKIGGFFLELSEITWSQ